MRSRAVLGCLAAAAAAAQGVLAASASDPFGAYQNKLGAVASENKHCSSIGIDMLRKGGNAADAMVGTVFCVGVLGMCVSLRVCSLTVYHADSRDKVPLGHRWRWIYDRPRPQWHVRVYRFP